MSALEGTSESSWSDPADYTTGNRHGTKRGAGQYSPASSIYLATPLFPPVKGKGKVVLWKDDDDVDQQGRYGSCVISILDTQLSALRGFSHLFLPTAAEVTTSLLLIPHLHFPMLLARM